MAYAPSNGHTNHERIPHHFSPGNRNVRAQPYINGFTSNNASNPKTQPDLVHAPLNGTQYSQQYVAQRDHLPRPRQSVQVVIPSPRQTPSHSSVRSPARPANIPAIIPSQPPLDYEILLLALADDYFQAAYSGGYLVALRRRESDARAYYKLIATGLGCLEAVLKNWRLQPLFEARIRLCYATVLYDETENSMEAEEALTKGIILSERLHNFDLKYNMQYLLARVLYRRNHQASLKYIDRVIGDIEAYQHVAWIYAFRFLRVSLSLESASRPDVLSALSHVRNIVSIANRQGDGAILALASIQEALCHLRMPNSTENLEQVLRTLAVARSLQFDTAVAQIPQLAALTSFVDLCCFFYCSDPAQAVQKLRETQETLETIHAGPSWSDRGDFVIPIKHTQVSQDQSCKGILQDRQDGLQGLSFTWMPKEYIYSLGYLLSGIGTAHKNPLDGQRSEQMLTEGLRKQEVYLKAASELPQPLSIATSHLCSWQSLKCHLQLQLVFVLCARTAWAAASERLCHLKESMEVLQGQLSTEFRISALYLEGIIYQGTGFLDEALSIFQDPCFSLPQPNKPPSSKHYLEISLLAALNALLILRSRSSNSAETATLIDRLGPLCAENPNKAIVSAYNLILATAPSVDTIVRTKQCLQNALQAAKVCSNNQLMCMTLNLMSWKFFRGVVGQQAEKSARASQSLANKGQDTLWMSVSAGLLGDTLEIQGRTGEADAVRVEGSRVAGTLPQAVQRFEPDGIQSMRKDVKV